MGSVKFLPSIFLGRHYNALPNKELHRKGQLRCLVFSRSPGPGEASCPDVEDLRTSALRAYKEPR